MDNPPPATGAQILSRTLLLVLASRKLALTSAQEDRIARCEDLDQLDRWLDRAFDIGSPDELGELA